MQVEFLKMEEARENPTEEMQCKLEFCQCNTQPLIKSKSGPRWAPLSIFLDWILSPAL